MSKVFERYGFRYPVEISVTSIGPGGRVKDFPYIRPSHLIASMSKTNDLHRLLGGMKTLEEAKPVLTEFWKRWRVVHPAHSVFQMGIPLEKAVPLYLHGDEGEHFKKSAVLVASFQSALGYGSVRRPLDKALPPEIETAGIPINFLRTALQTRFLVALAPKEIVLKRSRTRFHLQMFQFKLWDRCLKENISPFIELHDFEQAPLPFRKCMMTNHLFGMTFYDSL